MDIVANGVEGNKLSVMPEFGLGETVVVDTLVAREVPLRGELLGASESGITIQRMGRRRFIPWSAVRWVEARDEHRE